MSWICTQYFGQRDDKQMSTPPVPDDDPVPAEPTDPYDVDALRSKALGNFPVEKRLLTVPARKPKRKEFFRTHPSPEYTVDARVFEREKDLDREIYWVVPELWEALATELTLVRLFTCVNRYGVVFLWPAKLPREEGNSGRLWQESALEVADAARTTWVRMQGKRELGAYELFVAEGNLGEPEWPPLSFRALIELAFKARTIDALTHDVLRELRGEL